MEIYKCENTKIWNYNFWGNVLFFLFWGGGGNNRIKLSLDFLYRNISNLIINHFFEFFFLNVKLNRTKTGYILVDLVLWFAKYLVSNDCLTFFMFTLHTYWTIIYKVWTLGVYIYVCVCARACMYTISTGYSLAKLAN